MNPLLSNTLEALRVKVANLVATKQTLEKELKVLQLEKQKLETALQNALSELESEKNKQVAQELGSKKIENAELIKQIDKYIKLIDTSIAQVKSDV